MPVCAATRRAMYVRSAGASSLLSRKLSVHSLVTSARAASFPAPGAGAAVPVAGEVVGVAAASVRNNLSTYTWTGLIGDCVPAALALAPMPEAVDEINESLRAAIQANA